MEQAHKDNISKAMKSKKPRLTEKCPECGKQILIISIFGTICGNDKCFYKG
jgi:hypothetical protein